MKDRKSDEVRMTSKQYKTIGILFILALFLVLSSNCILRELNDRERYTFPEHISSQQVEIFKRDGCWRVTYDAYYKTNVCITRQAVIEIKGGNSLGEVLFVRKQKI